VQKIGKQAKFTISSPPQFLMQLFENTFLEPQNQQISFAEIIFDIFTI
jgi:hypothetical protein